MFKKYEIIGFGVSAAIMLIALWFWQFDVHLSNLTLGSQQAASTGLVVVGQNTHRQAAESDIRQENREEKGLIIDDIKAGTGPEVQQGDTVTVHYVGAFQNGEEFDNSHRRGEPITFRVGRNQVIPGWEDGLLSMRKGGTRVLVIPPEQAYGVRGYGPIPGDTTLVFTIELLSIN